MKFQEQLMTFPLETEHQAVVLRGRVVLSRYEIARFEMEEPFDGYWLPGPHVPYFARGVTGPLLREGQLTQRGREYARGGLAHLYDLLKQAYPRRQELARLWLLMVGGLEPPVDHPSAPAPLAVRLLRKAFRAGEISQKEYQHARRQLREAALAQYIRYGEARIRALESLQEEFGVEIPISLIDQMVRAVEKESKAKEEKGDASR